MKMDPKIAPQSASDLAAMAALGAVSPQGSVFTPTAETMEKGGWTAEALARANPELSARSLVKGGAAPAAKAADGDPEDPDELKKDKEQLKADGLAKSDDKDEDDKEKDDEDEEEPEEKSISDSDLMKAAKALDSIALGAKSPAIEDERATLAKAWAKGEISDEDRGRLENLIKSDSAPSVESYAEIALQDPDVQAQHVDENGVDVSGFLGRQSAFMAGALDQVAERMAKSFGSIEARANAQSAVLVSLAKAVVEQGKLIKSLGTDVDALASAALPRRSAPTARALQKSFMGATDSLGGMNHPTIMKGLMQLSQAYRSGTCPCGEDLSTAIAAYEGGQGLSPGMITDVKKILGM
jgi:hypothetical protein